MVVPSNRSNLQRAVRLGLGIVLLTAGVVSVVNAGVGVSPYDVLQTGLVEATGLSFGLLSALTAAVFILIGWALRVRPGVGTVVLTLALGPMFDVTFLIAPEPEALAVRILMFIVGTIVTGLAVALFISAELGPPGFEMTMLGLAARGLPLRWVRTGMELAVFFVGWALGGQVGIGTVVFALGFGHILQAWLDVLGERTDPDEVKDVAASV